MAIRQSDKIKAAFFLAVSIVLFVLLVLTLVGTEWMKSKNLFYIDFTDSVKGLNVGSPVRYSGVNVGKVKRLKTLTNMVTRVTIEVQVGTPIQLKSVARLDIDSLIVGNRFVQITPGPEGNPLMTPNSQAFIIESKPAEFDVVSGQITEMSGQGGILLSNLTLTFNARNAERMASILSQIDDFLITNRPIATETLLQLRETMKKMDTAMDAAKIKETSEQLRATMIRMDEAIRSANELLVVNQKAINDTVKNLRVTTELLNELLEKVNRQPSVLVRGTEQPKEE